MGISRKRDRRIWGDQKREAGGYREIKKGCYKRMVWCIG